MQSIHKCGIVLLVTAIGLSTLSACSGGHTMGTALGVDETFESADGEGTYLLTAAGLSGEHRIGPPPSGAGEVRPARITVEATVGREPGKLHLVFDAPEDEPPLIIDLEGGQTATGSGVGLVSESEERVLYSFNAYKVGAGQVRMTVDFEYLD
jgi:hypothetical protein